MPLKPVPHVRCIHITKCSWQLEVQSWPLWTTTSACWPEKMLPRKFHLNDTDLVYHSRFSSPTRAALIKSWISSGASQTTSPSSAFLSASLAYKFLWNSPWSSEPSMAFSTYNSNASIIFPKITWWGVSKQYPTFLVSICVLICLSVTMIKHYDQKELVVEKGLFVFYFFLISHHQGKPRQELKVQRGRNGSRNLGWGYHLLASLHCSTS